MPMFLPSRSVSSATPASLLTSSSSMDVWPSTPTATRSASLLLATATSENEPSDVIWARPAATTLTLAVEKPACSSTSRQTAS